MNLFRPVILFCLVICLHFHTVAQDIIQRMYSCQDGLSGQCIVPTEDNGAILSCDVIQDISFNNYFYRIVLIKVDSIGNMDWHWGYEGIGFDHVSKLIPAIGNAYVGAGSTTVGPIGIGVIGDTIQANIRLMKVDSTGNLLWSRSFGDTLEDLALDILEADSGDYVIAGRTGQYSLLNDNSGDILLMKTDSAGNIKWSQSIASTGGYRETAFAISHAPDNGFYLSGYVRDYFNPLHDVFILRTDRDGNILWSKRMNEPNTEQLSIHMAPDFSGGFVLCYLSYVYDWLSGDLNIANFDSLGNVKWVRKYGSTANGGDAYVSLNRCQDSSGYVLGGTWAFKIDTGGSVLWFDIVSQLAFTGFQDLKQTRKKGYFGIGATRHLNNINRLFFARLSSSGINCIKTNFIYPIQTINVQPIPFLMILNPLLLQVNSGLNQIPILITDSILCQGYTGIHENENSKNPIRIFPNPVKDKLSIEWHGISGFNKLEIFNGFGELVYIQNHFIKQLDLVLKFPGLYFVRFSSPNGIYTSKFVKIN